jgi:quinol monooxygenase YgiN
VVTTEKGEKGARMTYVAAYDKTHAEEGCHYYSWLEDYLERLEGKEAYREVQERCCDDPEYYTLVASLAA